MYPGSCHYGFCAFSGKNTENTEPVKAWDEREDDRKSCLTIKGESRGASPGVFSTYSHCLAVSISLPVSCIFPLMEWGAGDVLHGLLYSSHNWHNPKTWTPTACLLLCVQGSAPVSAPVSPCSHKLRGWSMLTLMFQVYCSDYGGILGGA